MLNAIVQHRQPIAPIPTEVKAQLKPLNSIRAVVFDVYGTLVVSGSGDVGSVNAEDRGAKIVEAIDAVGIEIPENEIPTIKQLHAQIQASNESRQSESCPKPEVDIIEVWRNVLPPSAKFPGKFSGNETSDVARLSAEYEARANPTWAMPGASELIRQLRGSNLPLGIVSNAQVFTVPLVESLGGDPATRVPLQELGFELNLCIFSNRYRQAKPGPRLFEALVAALHRQGIGAGEAIYVGNDMLNDIWAASQAGLKTAWFAGDQRSCRPRHDDARCQTVEPDLILTELMQLPDCLQIH